MNTHLRSFLIATALFAMSFSFVSCGGDNGVPPPPPQPSPPSLSWENPKPTGDVLHAVWGASATDVFAVGEAGTLLRYDGQDWKRASSHPGDGILWDIWGTGPDDVFAVGEGGAIWHYDGAAWEALGSPTTETLRGVFGFSPSDVWVVGHNGTVLRYDGAGWNPMQSGTSHDLLSVWGASNTDVYAVTDAVSTPLIHYTVTSGWRERPITLMAARDVWGTSSSDVFVVGSGGTVLHFDGVSWELSTPGGSENLFSVFGFSPTDVVAVGTNSTVLRYDGANWNAGTVSAQAYDLFAVWGSGPNDLHALGGPGALFDFAGVAWGRASEVVTREEIRGMTTTRDGLQTYAVGTNGTILSRAGSTPVWTEMTSGTTTNLNSVFADSPTNIFAVGDDGEILRFDGAWSAMASGTTGDLSGVWGASPTNMVAVGPNDLLQYDGSSWSPMTVMGPITGALAVWGVGGNDIFAVGSAGSIIRYNGTEWSPMTSPVTTTLRTVFARSSTDVYAAGDAGIVLRYDGDSWTDVMLGALLVDFETVIVSNREGVFAAGPLGAICYLKGSAGGTAASQVASLQPEWEELLFTSQFLNAATVRSGGAVFFGGGDGTIIRFGR